jgi:LPXTG-motif cell wall-anchored protein
MTVGAGAPAQAGDGHDGGHSQSRGGDHRDDQGGDHGDHGDHSSDHRDDHGSDHGKDDHGSDHGKGDERGHGHTPVTVCHLLGNGSYHVLTFDDNALKAHVNHGDIYPVPADGCPASSEEVRPTKFHGKPGHVRVTVCHLLGNGGYHELTFDEHALRAHEAHGDLYPVPAEGCPTAAPEETAPGTTPGDDTPGTPGDDTPGTPGDDTPAEENPAEENPGVIADETDDQAVVKGVEQSATPQRGEGEVLGVEATAGVNRAAPATGPLDGILPQTGAGQLLLAALAAGLGLIAAGVTIVTRRRTQGSL